MLIEKIVVVANESADFGLQPFEMNRLGRFVVLAGKNGAGKSRIINQLVYLIQQRNQYLIEDRIDEKIRSIESFIQNNPPEHVNQSSWKNTLKVLLNQISLATDRICPPINTPLGVLYFVPKQLNLENPRQNNKADLQTYFDQAKEPGFNGYENRCFSYIQILQDMEFAASHPRSTQVPAVIQETIEEYEKLQSLIDLLLKTRISRSESGDATLFGKPLAEAILSDGQKVLIQLAVALHAQKGKLDNTVFLMDEPENHLHPSVLIDFLDTLAEVATNAQFWIATHSVPLLAHIANKEPMAIWYVEDGKVSNAGSKPEKVLRGLLGDDEQIENLNAFTSLPAQYAAIRFSIECLTEPKTVAGRKGDPQVAQIRGLLDFDAISPISLLDYGAGKSRLLSGLVEIAADQGKNLSDSVSYFAFDPSPDDKEDSLAVIESIYGNGATRHFLADEDFFSSKADASLDVVVMCNVLHEISPNDWVELFNELSLIGRSLKDSGCLLIVEDQRIPTGEKAHEFGFLVLDTLHLRTLFAVKNDDDENGLFLVSDHRGDGRLKAHKISKELLNRMTRETQKRAIEQLRETAKEEIRKLRKVAPNYPNGQLHGFWTQQFANASLWLDEQQCRCPTGLLNS